MTTKFIAKARQLGMNPNECNWFQFFAQETWDRIGFARTRKGLKIFETTITQNLIFEYQSSKELYEPMMRRTWGIDVKESVNEKTNGNDIELYIDINGTFYFFAMQAKIINHEGFKRSGMLDGNYRYISHQVGQINQIDLLIDYAKSKGGIPLYLLYNYVKNNFAKNNLCNVDYEIEQYGCSVINADYIRRQFLNVGDIWTVPKFSDLHPSPALPWFVIACCFMQKDIDQVLKMLGLIDFNASSLTSYNLGMLLNDKNWTVLQPFKEIEEITSQTRDNFSEIYDQIEFRPKYRCILSPRLSYEIKR